MCPSLQRNSTVSLEGEGGTLLDRVEFTYMINILNVAYNRYR